MLAYLASPIDLATGVEDDRLAARSALDKAGFAVYDPSAPYSGRVMANAAAVMHINGAALERADALLALLPEGAASVGVPMEIRDAVGADKPVAVVGVQHSVQLAGMRVCCWPTEEVEAATLWLSGAVEEWRANSRDLLWTGDGAEPTKSYEGDAGYDLVCSKSTAIPIGGFADVPCGVRVQMPRGVWGRITGRSSTLRRRRLLVAEGVIDNGYRGELFCGVQNLGDEKAVVEAGERVAQLLLHNDINLRTVRVEELGESVRGEQGFGSTGG